MDRDSLTMLDDGADDAPYALLDLDYDLYCNLLTFALDSTRMGASALITFALDTSAVNDEPRPPRQVARCRPERLHGHVTVSR